MTRTKKPLLVLTSLAAVAAVAATSVAAPAQEGAKRRAPMLLGVMDDGLFAGQPAAAFQAVSQLRAQVIRYDVDWPTVATRRPKNAKNPNDPAYNWTAADRVALQANVQRVPIVFSVVHTPV